MVKLQLIRPYYYTGMVIGVMFYAHLGLCGFGTGITAIVFYKVGISGSDFIVHANFPFFPFSISIAKLSWSPCVV